MSIKNVLLFGAIICLIAAGASAEEENGITVSGDSEVRVTPDEVIIIFAVQNDDLDVNKAKAENDRLVAEVLQALADHGIPDKHIQTDYFVITPKYTDWRESTFEGFFVRKTIVVTLKDANIFDDVLTSVVAAGATHIRNIDFRTTELRKYRDQARAVAIKAAEDKA
ncbi:MAG: SIMPL domain-containing protein, partial [Candidatus Zixiibacteriota bacterium]